MLDQQQEQYLLSAVRSNQNNIKALAKRLEDFYSEWDKFLDFGIYDMHTDLLHNEDGSVHNGRLNRH